MLHRNLGLTVIELMVVLAILAVVMTAAVPAASRLIENTRVTAATNELVAHLQFARHEAVHRNGYVAVCPSADGENCTGGNRWDHGWIVYADPDNSRQPTAPEDVLRSIAPDHRLKMHSAGRTRVRFQGHGGAYGTNLTIRVCDPGQVADARAVIVSNPGRIRSTREVDAEECEV